MAEVKWIKIVTDIFYDEKMLLIETLPEADSIIVIWFKLLCFAGMQNNSGVFTLNNKIAYNDEMFASIFRRPLNIVRLALKTFEQYGMVEVIDNVVTIPNWEKHQSLDKLEQAREQTRKRVAKHRQKQQLLAECNGDVTLHVTQSNANRIEKDIEKERDIEEEGEETGQKLSGPASPTSKLEKMGGTLGQGVLMLTEAQIDDLLDKLSIDEYDLYCKKLSDYIIAHPEKTFKSHYQTILKWVTEDRARV